MIRLIHFFISMILSLLAYAASAQEFKLGKIGNNEFHKMATITDSSAGAIVLKHYRETHFDYDDAKGWIIVTKVQQRTKILKKEGISYATHKVKAYKKNKDKEFVTNVEGYTYTSENDVFSKEKLDKNAIFETENSEYWDSYSWTMPNVRIGSVLEWEYTLTSPFWKVDDLNIQQDLPVEEYEAVIRMPTSFKFNRLKKGYFEVAPVTAFKKRLEAVMMGQNTGYGGRSSINTRSATMALTEQIDTYHLENIPALQHEAFVDNIENYRYTIVYELNAVQYGDGHTKKYATSWGDVAKSIMDAEHFGKQLDKINFLYTDAGNIKKKGTGEELLIHNAFEFVRDNFSWNGKYGKYVEDDLNKVYKSRSGNDAEINLTLLALLKACGVSAHPVLISTKENGIPMFPTLEGFNYVIVGVRLKDELILLDATEKYSQPNVLPSRVYNWEGRMIFPNGFS
ncbi:MAG: DUF3857 domain-containing protein, partial [Leeuwenhoekiella sp.]